MPCKLDGILRFKSNSPPEGVCTYPGITRTRNFCKLALMPVPGSAVSPVHLCHNTRNFWKICKTSIPVPGTSMSCVRHSCPYPELLCVLHTPCHNPRGAGTAPARNFCELCTPVPQIPGNAGSSVTLPYPYPKILEVLQDSHTLTGNPQNPTEHNLGNLRFFVWISLLNFARSRIWNVLLGGKLLVVFGSI